jgi:hypothetical protein
MKLALVIVQWNKKEDVPLRKVILTMNEEFTYQHVKRFVDQSGNFNALCMKLDCSERTARRKIAGYREEGRAFFRHGNHDNRPRTTIPEELKDEIVSIYNQLYFDANFIHFHELLQRNHPEIPTFSLSSIRNILKAKDILSPKAWRRTEKALRAKDKLAEKAENLTPDDVTINCPSISLDPHPRREKSRYAGECIYLDASIHIWFAGQIFALHAAIDDATGTLVAARFELQETLQGYYQILAQILRNYGIPYLFRTDGRTVFDYKRKGATSLEADTSTQFSYACKSLGIDIHSTTCAQSQGKVERLFQTLQSRLVVELRLQNVTTIEQANDFLMSYIPIHNKKFATPINSIPSAFEAQPSEEDINLTLAVLSSRVVDLGNCISYRNQYYRFLDSDGKSVPLSPKQKVKVVRALDGRLFATCKDSVFSLEPVARHKARSWALDAPLDNPVRKSPYVPSLIHPWKDGRFESYATDYRKAKYSFEEMAYTTENFYDTENSCF